MSQNQWGSTVPIPVAKGGTNVATLTDGGVLLGQGTGSVTATAVLAKGSLLVGQTSADPVELTVGSNDQVLVSSSTATEGLEWQKRGSDDNLVLLETITLSNDASVTTSATIDGTYVNYMIEIIELIPATDSSKLKIQFSEAGGSLLTASTYSYTSKGNDTNRVNTDDGAASVGFGYLSSNATTVDLSNVSSESFCARIDVFNPSSTATNPSIVAHTGYWGEGTDIIAATVSVGYKSAKAIDAYKFFMDSGNLTSGTIKIYGVS